MKKLQTDSLYKFLGFGDKNVEEDLEFNVVLLGKEYKVKPGERLVMRAGHDFAVKKGEEIFSIEPI